MTFGNGSLKNMSSMVLYPQIYFAQPKEKQEEVDKLIEGLFGEPSVTDVNTMLEILHRADDMDDITAYVNEEHPPIDTIGAAGRGASCPPGHVFVQGLVAIGPEYKSIGEIVINADNLRVRNAPSTSGDIKGKIGSFSETCDHGSQPVYAMTEAEGYTWYDIGGGNWVAGNEDWVTFKAFTN